MNNIITISSPNPGARVAIFGGVHGNERAGILTLDYLAKNLTVERGIVHLVYANPEAITANTRMINKNLNRLFLRGRSIETYEDARAKELMDLLDTCDALLDLHSYNDTEPNMNIFAICEDNCEGLARTLGVPFRIAGFTATEPGGSEGYMYKSGKPGVCIELGSVNISEKMSHEGIKIAMKFLQYFDCLRVDQKALYAEQTQLTATIMYKKQTDNFRFTQPFKTLDFVARGTVIAIDGDHEFIAQEDSYILFPRAEYAIGIEAFILASVQKR